MIAAVGVQFALRPPIYENTEDNTNTCCKRYVFFLSPTIDNHMEEVVLWVVLDIPEKWEGQDGPCGNCGKLRSEHPDWILPDRVVKYCNVSKS